MSPGVMSSHAMSAKAIKNKTIGTNAKKFFGRCEDPFIKEIAEAHFYRFSTFALRATIMVIP